MEGRECTKIELCKIGDWIACLCAFLHMYSCREYVKHTIRYMSRIVGTFLDNIPSKGGLYERDPKGVICLCAKADFTFLKFPVRRIRYTVNFSRC